MSEKRWNPILSQWVITATHRQDRTFLPPAGYCPLCPTKPGGFPTEVPQENYDFVVFENKFPSLQYNPPTPEVVSTNLYPVEPSNGICEVVLYTSSHDSTLTTLPLERLVKLVRVWKDRYEDLSTRKEISYVLVFENKGEEVGVTIHHPHGQIYAFPYIPPVVEREIVSEQQHFEKTGHCLHCDVLHRERSDNQRIIAFTQRFLAFVPFYARLPYEVHVYPIRHLESMAQFDPVDEMEFALILQAVLQKYDNLWSVSMPYIMVMHQAPTNGKHYPGSHFHVEFYPPYRTHNKLKYLAGCETGAGTFVNDSIPEEKAAELRNVKPMMENINAHR